jgi:ABC-2 type transport system permease protein
MVVFRREFMRNLKGLLIWGLSIAALAGMMLAAFKGSGNASGAAAYPEAFVKAMGMDRVDMDTMLGYYGVKVSVIVTLFGGIYAALLGGGAVVRDEALLARPIGRASIALQRMLAVSLGLLLLNLLVALVLLLAGAGAVSLWIGLVQFLLHMSLAAAGFLVAALRLRQKAALALPLGIVLAGYVLTLLYGMVGGLEFLKYLTPFYYTDVKEVIASGAPQALNCTAVSAIIAVLVSLGTGIYTRKDLPV